MEVRHMENTAQTQTERAADEIKARRRFKINLLIYLSVNALIILAWAVLAAVGVAMKHMALNLAIYLVVMAIWGARIAIGRHHARRAHVFTEEQIQREITKLSS
jgi:Flp pilus assembly protein TadB